MIKPVVICPLDHERRLIRKAVGPHAQIVVSGPGPRAVHAAVDAITDAPPLVVLCGVAGALAEAPDAPRIHRVLDRDAREWKVPVTLPGSDEPVTLLGLDDVVTTIDRKLALHRAFAASLVDTESHAFADACERRALRWTIVRAVSDGPRESLPAGVAEWVDEQGRARLGRFLRHCLLEPSAFFAAIRLHRRTRRAMRAAAARLVELLNVELRAASEALRRQLERPRSSAEPAATAVASSKARSLS